MVHSVAEALFTFSQRYLEAYQAEHQHLPENEELVDWISPCVEQKLTHSVYWKPVVREVAADLTNVENGIEIAIHEDIHAFYGVQFGADMPATWRGNRLNLLQVWSDDDFERLQENILGHLVMQRRLKQKPTIFIATTDDEMQVVSICNISGNVILETLGIDKREMLAEDIASFLTQLEPEVAA